MYKAELAEKTLALSGVNLKGVAPLQPLHLNDELLLGKNWTKGNNKLS